VTGGAGLSAFTEQTVRDERILALSSKVRYVVNPNDPYPKAYTGHIRMTLKDGRVFEERQPHIRGGVHEPLTRQEIAAKFRSNAAWGGWEPSQAEDFLAYAGKAFDAPDALAAFRR
jgi:2-methylcitrate dehydratase PrpD